MQDNVEKLKAVFPNGNDVKETADGKVKINVGGISEKEMKELLAAFPGKSLNLKRSGLGITVLVNV